MQNKDKQNKDKWTYSLTINTQEGGTKEELKAKLTMLGVESFVEGCVDDLDIPMETPQPLDALFSEHQGDQAPIEVYSFDREDLLRIRDALTKSSLEVECSLAQIATEAWQEGWKESFKPVNTDLFCVLPPWEQPSDVEKTSIVIDPGMAFGTGQHATTFLCLKMIELHASSDRGAQSFMDMGTGSGVLAIAACKLGYHLVSACDIDADAMQAAPKNFAENHCQVKLWRGDIAEREGTYDWICANILSPVLIASMPLFAQHLAKNGSLLLSGLLVEQKAEVIAAGKQVGLVLSHELSHQGWACLLLRFSQSIK